MAGSRFEGLEPLHAVFPRNGAALNTPKGEFGNRNKAGEVVEIAEVSL
jgi:hypothetical protein